MKVKRSDGRSRFFTDERNRADGRATLCTGVRLCPEGRTRFGTGVRTRPEGRMRFRTGVRARPEVVRGSAPASEFVRRVGRRSEPAVASRRGSGNVLY